MEDVRTVLVDQDSVFVIVVIRVAADVRSLVDHQHLFPKLRSKPLRDHSSRKTRSYDQIVKPVY